MELELTQEVPDTTGKQQGERNPDGTFKEGVSGNPLGRPVGSKNFTTKVKEALEKLAVTKDGKVMEVTYEELLVKSVLNKAINQGDSRMIKLLWNYLDGMPPQSMDLTSKGERMGQGGAEFAELATAMAEELRKRKTQSI